jgi:regulator of cell morphogenesis and NO signaling
MVIQVNDTTTVRDLVGRYPQTRPVFEKYGIDYCCGGNKHLAEAAHERHVDVAALVDALTKSLDTPIEPGDHHDRDWNAASLTELVNHIVEVHHAYMKMALPRLRGLLSAVIQAHSRHHGATLRQVQTLFDDLDEEISSHLMKEEKILFPFITAMELHSQKNQPIPLAPCGSVSHPVQQMEHEHESAGKVLAKLREVTSDYALPPDACPTFKAMYEELRRMEADLHRHIHLENNILFPRAIDLETNCLQQ